LSLLNDRKMSGRAGDSSTVLNWRCLRLQSLLCEVSGLCSSCAFANCFFALWVDRLWGSLHLSSYSHWEEGVKGAEGGDILALCFSSRIIVHVVLACYHCGQGFGFPKAQFEKWFPFQGNDTDNGIRCLIWVYFEYWIFLVYIPNKTRLKIPAVRVNIEYCLFCSGK
jgi:hypothetical protein